MGLELIIFIAAILFGIFLYWRESNGNGAYRALNKLVNSKDLQMKPGNKKGFVFQQSFIPRLIFVVSLFLIIAVLVQFLSPFDIFGSYNGISAFASVIFGTLIGTYIAGFVIKSSEVLDEHGNSLEDFVDESLEKGKEFVKDLKNKDNKAVEEAKEEIKSEPEADQKSARERLKDKGLL